LTCKYCKDITVCVICGKGYAEAAHESPPTIPADVGRRAMWALQDILRKAEDVYERMYYSEPMAHRRDLTFNFARAAITELQQYLGEKKDG
jgi:hypothetical protein